MLRSILVLVIFLFGCGPSQEEIDIAIGSAIDNIPETITPVIILDSDHRIVVGDSEFSVELAGWQPQANVSITIFFFSRNSMVASRLSPDNAFDTFLAIFCIRL